MLMLCFFNIYEPPLFKLITFLLVVALFVAFVLGFALHGLRKSHSEKLKDWFVRSPWLVKLVIFILVMQLVINFRQDNVQPFIYAQF